MKTVTMATSVLPGWHALELLEAWWRERRPGWVDPSWWSLPMRADLLDLLRLHTGPELIAQLERLGGGACPGEHEPEPYRDSSGYPCACKVVLAAAWEAAASWSAVRSAGALVDAAGPQPVVVEAVDRQPGIIDPAREELAVALRVHVGSAERRIRKARELAAQPAVAALAAEGVLPLSSVSNVCEDLAGLSERDAADVARQWLADVRGRLDVGRAMTGTGAVREATRRILAAESHRDRRKRARSQRRVELWPNLDGTTTLGATLREEDALRVHRRLTAMAKALDDDRPIDARRADLMVDLLLGRAESRCSGVEVNVTAPLEVLIGLRDGVAEIPGFGPIPGDVARDLAADARWRAWVTDAVSGVRSISHRTYRPSAALARLVRARSAECMMPGCSRPSDQCDIDHAVPWPQGPTSASNLGPLCRRHHILKTHYEWGLDLRGGVWSTPAGAEVGIGAA